MRRAALSRVKTAPAAFVPALLLCAALIGSCQPEPAGDAEPGVPDHPPLSAAVTEALPDRWTRFRGPVGSGIAQFDNLPVRWDVDTGDNILWSTPLPLSGANSAVIWKDLLFVTGADDGSRAVYCLDAHSGEMRWTRHVAPEWTDTPRTHAMTGYAAPTCVTDGSRVYASFPSGHVIALDFDGEIAWKRWFDFSEDIYGRATSPVLHEGLLILQIDLGKPDIGRSHIKALDSATGRTRWRSRRPVQGSWTTPIVIDIGGRHELVTSAKPWVIAYDPATGEDYWRVRCVEGDSAPSPIYAAGQVYVANIYAELTAIVPGGTGDVTRTRVRWSERGELPDITSPLSDGRLIWTLSTGGMLACRDAESGELQYRHRLPGRYRSSPALVGDSLYLISEAGKSTVIAAEPEFEKIAPGSFGERVYSSPAFAHGRMYIRGTEHIICVGEQ